MLCVSLLFSLSPAVSEIEEAVWMEKCSMSMYSDDVEHILSLRGPDPAIQLCLPCRAVLWPSLSHFRPVPDTLETLLVVLLRVVLSFKVCLT